ncbi:hypothetical protein HNV12_08465 [Methanococcoides sp. SA1]|nr:hypothetical protein [Methanococcoides sp. SA1]
MEPANKIFSLIVLTCLLLICIFPVQAYDELEPVKVSYNYGGVINSIDYSPDGRHIAAGYSRGYVRLWDTVGGESLSFTPDLVENKRLMGLLGDEPYRVRDVVFSPDGKYLLVSSSDYDYATDEFVGSHLTLYDVETGAVVRTHEMNESYVWEVAYSPDGKSYAAPYEMNQETETSTIYLWDLETGKVVNTITSNNFRATSLAFTPDGRYLVVSFFNYVNPDRIVFFDLKSGDAEKTIEESSVSDLQFSDDGHILAAKSRHYDEAIVWDSPSGEELYRIKDFRSPPFDISLSSDGNFLVGVTGSRMMAWNVSSRYLILDISDRDQIDSYECIDFSKDDSYVAVGAVLEEDSKYDIGREASLELSGKIDDYRELPSSVDVIFIYDFQDIKEYDGKVYFRTMLESIPMKFLLIVAGLLFIFTFFLRKYVDNKSNNLEK